MNQFKTNIPQNPPTTILFYNENSQSIDNINQNLICNSNCDLVPAKKITPSIGKYTSNESEKKKEEKKISGAELSPEKCETKDVWMNKPTKPILKDPIKPDGSTPNLDNRDPTVIVALTVSFLILFVIITFVGFFKYTNKNKLSIIFLVIALVSIIIGLSVGCILFTQKPEGYAISYVLGMILWLISMIFLYITRNYNSNEYSIGYSSFNSAISPQQNSTINVPTGFNQPKQSFFGKMFSRSSSQDKPTNYSPQITVPTAQNTQPKQSFFDRMFKKSNDSSAPVASSAPVPQSFTTSASVKPTMVSQSSTSSASVKPTTVSQSSTSSVASVPQPKQSFLSKINPFSKKEVPLTQDIIQFKTKLLEDIQRSNLNSINKKKLMNTINTSSSSNIVQRLNTASKELNRLNTAYKERKRLKP
jgi:hypothetical protein